MSKWLNDITGRMLATAPWREQAVRLNYRSGLLSEHIRSFTNLVWRAVEGFDVESELRLSYKRITFEAGALGRIAMGATAAHREAGTLKQRDDDSAVPLPPLDEVDDLTVLIPLQSTIKWLDENSADAITQKSPRP